MTPTGRLLAPAGLCAVPLAAGAAAAPWAEAGLLAAALAAAAAWDALRSLSPAAVAVEREAAEIFSVGAPDPVALHLTNRGRAAITVEVQDSPPVPGAVGGLPAGVAAAADLRVRQRRRAVALAADSVLVVEATPENLGAALVSRYLEGKAKRLL